jgi:hypothetical protein
MEWEIRNHENIDEPNSSDKNPELESKFVRTGFNELAIQIQ